MTLTGAGVPAPLSSGVEFLVAVFWQ